MDARYIEVLLCENPRGKFPNGIRCPSPPQRIRPLSRARKSSNLVYNASHAAHGMSKVAHISRGQYPFSPTPRVVVMSG